MMKKAIITEGNDSGYSAGQTVPLNTIKDLNNELLINTFSSTGLLDNQHIQL